MTELLISAALHNTTDHLMAVQQPFGREEVAALVLSVRVSHVNNDSTITTCRGLRALEPFAFSLYMHMSTLSLVLVYNHDVDVIHSPGLYGNCNA